MFSFKENCTQYTINSHVAVNVSNDIFGLKLLIKLIEGTQKQKEKLKCHKDIRNMLPFNIDLLV